MKYAQVDPRQTVQVVVGWDVSVTPMKPIVGDLQASNRIIFVEDSTSPIGYPMFWVECADDVQPDVWYYNTAFQTVELVPPPAPKPTMTDQPVVDGAQTL